MSLAHQFFREFAPVFRMLDEPMRSPNAPQSSLTRQNSAPFATLFNDSGFALNKPAIDLTEYSKEFVVEAELPGVKKENIEIKIGEGGQRLTIEGKSFVRSSSNENERAETPAAAKQSGGVAAAENATPANGAGSHAVTQTNTDTREVGRRLTSERLFSSSSSFSETIWLPRRVDGSKVTAKLEDGILTLHIPKAEDPETVRVTVE